MNNQVEYPKGTLLRYVGRLERTPHDRQFIVAVTGKGSSKTTFKGIVVARGKEASWAVGYKASNWTRFAVWEVVNLNV